MSFENTQPTKHDTTPSTSPKTRNDPNVSGFITVAQTQDNRLPPDFSNSTRIWATPPTGTSLRDYSRTSRGSVHFHGLEFSDNESPTSTITPSRQSLPDPSISRADRSSLGCSPGHEPLSTAPSHGSEEAADQTSNPDMESNSSVGYSSAVEQPDSPSSRAIRSTQTETDPSDQAVQKRRVSFVLQDPNADGATVLRVPGESL